MPERNHEVVIDGYVFPDTVTVTLANDEHIDSRDYVSRELYESVCGANDAWQDENARLRSCLSDDAENAKLIMGENAKLRELVRELWTYAEQELVCDWTCPYGAVCDWRDCVFTRRMRELGIEVD